MFFIPIKFIKRKKKVLLDNMKKSLFYHFWLITKHKISSSKTSQTNMMNLDSIKEYFPFIFYISNLSLAGTKKRFIRKTRKSIYPHRPHFLHFYTKSFSSFYSRKPSKFLHIGSVSAVIFQAKIYSL